MKKVRHSVFETNSSSSHSVSISIDSEGILTSLAPNKKGVLTIPTNSYGWEWNSTNDTMEKLSYASVWAKDDPKLTEMLVETVKAHTGAKKVIFENVQDQYIDHQSAQSEGGEGKEIFTSPTTLKHWLFSPACYLFTGNDNEDAPPNFYDVEIDITYTHELSVEGTHYTHKFSEYPSEEELVKALQNIAKRLPLCNQNYGRNKEFSWCDVRYNSYQKLNADSLCKLKENKVVLYKISEEYDRTTGISSYQIDDTEEVNFTITKL